MNLIEALELVPVVGIFRRAAAGTTLPMAEAAADAGLKVLEVTMDSPDAAKDILRLRSRFGKDISIGAGTVTTLERLELAAESDAQFIVAPDTNPLVLKKAKALGLPTVPGALTPTEIRLALEHEPAAVKLFPSAPGGPGYVKAILGPFPDVALLCTGGITIESARSFLDAGALGVGLTSELFDPPDPEQVHKRVTELLAHIRKD